MNFNPLVPARTMSICHWFLSAIVGVIVIVGVAHARPPEIRGVNVRGFQIGQPTIVTIDGAGLPPAPKLLLGANAVAATIYDKQSDANRAVLMTTLPNEAVPGLVELWLAASDGVSNRAIVAQDRLPPVPILETKTNYSGR